MTRSAQSYTGGPGPQLLVPARSRRKRRRPARMNSDQVGLEHRRRFQTPRAMRHRRLRRDASERRGAAEDMRGDR